VYIIIYIYIYIGRSGGSPARPIYPSYLPIYLIYLSIHPSIHPSIYLSIPPSPLHLPSMPLHSPLHSLPLHSLSLAPPTFQPPPQLFACLSLQREVVLLETPGALLTPWREDAKAIACLFAGGEKTGNAWANVLFGANLERVWRGGELASGPEGRMVGSSTSAANQAGCPCEPEGGPGEPTVPAGDAAPAGRLPIVFPATAQDTIHPGINDVPYHEEMLTSYRPRPASAPVRPGRARASHPASVSRRSGSGREQLGFLRMGREHQGSAGHGLPPKGAACPSCHSQHLVALRHG